MNQPSSISASASFERIAILAESRHGRVELCRLRSGPGEGTVVAVKRLPPPAADDAEQLAMFQDEMWMASALHHANIARVIAWGQDESGPYLAVEFVRGVSLARLMRTVFNTGEQFTERFIAHLGSSVCAGLATAHRLERDGEFLNLVHRDVTPGNILVSFEGEIKITDFGMAKAKRRATTTGGGLTKGAPAYMSPEQVRGQRLDARADIFALGVVLYELFAQRRPWDVKNLRDALRMIVKQPAPDLLSLCPRMDSALVRVISRCLAKDKEARYQSADDLKEDLDHWIHVHGYRDNQDSVARFTRRNALRQMRWLDRALAGRLTFEEINVNADADVPSPPRAPDNLVPSGQRAVASGHPGLEAGAFATVQSVDFVKSPDAPAERGWDEDGAEAATVRHPNLQDLVSDAIAGRNEAEAAADSEVPTAIDAVTANLDHRMAPSIESSSTLTRDPQLADSIALSAETLVKHARAVAERAQRAADNALAAAQKAEEAAAQAHAEHALAERGAATAIAAAEALETIASGNAAAAFETAGKLSRLADELRQGSASPPPLPVRVTKKTGLPKVGVRSK